MIEAKPTVIIPNTVGIGLTDPVDIPMNFPCTHVEMASVDPKASHPATIEAASGEWSGIEVSRNCGFHLSMWNFEQKQLPSRFWLVCVSAVRV